MLLKEWILLEEMDFFLLHVISKGRSRLQLDRSSVKLEITKYHNLD